MFSDLIRVVLFFLVNFYSNLNSRFSFKNMLKDLIKKKSMRENKTV